MQTTFGQWVSEHPDTAILDKGRSGSSDRYDGYYVNNHAGVIGESVNGDRLALKDKVLGIGFDGGPKAFPLSELDMTPVVNDRVTGENVVVFFQPDTDTALVFNRDLNGTRLEFDQAVDDDGTVLLRDRKTGSLFLPFTGRGIEGEYAGEQLERVHSVVAFWFAWSDFYPQTELYKAA